MNVGLFHPQFWLQHGHWGYENHTPGKSGKWKSINYQFNTSTVQDVDFIVVHEDVDKAVTFVAQGGGFVFVTGEERSTHKEYPQEFLDQFDCIITSRPDISHPHVIRTHYFHPWRVRKTYDELNAMKNIAKTKDLSAIISNQTGLPLQRSRVDLMVKLKGEYGDALDWFSKGGNNALTDKWDGLAPYKYSIAIENSIYPGYFTEKISDCFLAFSMPFYAGCPDVKNYFDERSFVSITPGDEIATKAGIDKTISTDLHAHNFAYITESRRLMLEKYQFIAAISDVLLKYTKSKVKESRKINPQRHFLADNKKPFLKRLFNR